MISQDNSPIPQSGLRERPGIHSVREENVSGPSNGVNTPQSEPEVEKEQKTFGRTPDGAGKAPLLRSVVQCASCSLLANYLHSIHGAPDS